MDLHGDKFIQGKNLYIQHVDPTKPQSMNVGNMWETLSEQTVQVKLMYHLLNIFNYIKNYGFVWKVLSLGIHIWKPYLKWLIS